MIPLAAPPTRFQRILQHPLIRYDIRVGLRQLYDAVKDEAIRKQVFDLITQK